MPPQPPVPLSLLIAKDLSYDWHDAVAIISQLIAQARAGGAVPASFPEFRLLSIEAGGIVTAVAPEPSVPAMPGAAALLQQLLSGRDQPPPLRLFAMQAATSEPRPTLEAFAEELAKYERPGRTARVAALYNQALEAIGVPALLEAAKDRAERPLTVKTAGADVPAASGAAAQAKSKKPASRDRQAQGNTAFNAALGVIALAAVAGGGAWYYLQQPSPAAPAPIVETTDVAPAAPAAPKRAPRPAVAGTADVPAADPARPAGTAAAESELAAARALLARRDYASASTALERVLDMLRADRSPQAEELRRAASGLIDISKAAVAEPASGGPERIYRSGDAGVTDPVPLSYLPPKPDPTTPAEDLQVLEVTVNTDGHVDSAKFVMNRPSFRNSWWTAAAKAWRFNPAMKDGHPVRYTMRIVMDDSDAQR